MKDNKIKALSANGVVDKSVLHELAASEDLLKFVVICMWDNNTVTTGWSGGITNTDLVFCERCLNRDIDDCLDNQGPPDE